MQARQDVLRGPGSRLFKLLGHRTAFEAPLGLSRCTASDRRVTLPELHLKGNLRPLSMTFFICRPRAIARPPRPRANRPAPGRLGPHARHQLRPGLAAAGPRRRHKDPQRARREARFITRPKPRTMGPQGSPLAGYPRLGGSTILEASRILSYARTFKMPHCSRANHKPERRGRPR